MADFSHLVLILSFIFLFSTWVLLIALLKCYHTATQKGRQENVCAVFGERRHKYLCTVDALYKVESRDDHFLLKVSKGLPGFFIALSLQDDD